MELTRENTQIKPQNQTEQDQKEWSYIFSKPHSLMSRDKKSNSTTADTTCKQVQKGKSKPINFFKKKKYIKMNKHIQQYFGKTKKT